MHCQRRGIDVPDHHFGPSVGVGVGRDHGGDDVVAEPLRPQGLPVGGKGVDVPARVGGQHTERAVAVQIRHVQRRHPLSPPVHVPQRPLPAFSPVRAGQHQKPGVGGACDRITPAVCCQRCQTHGGGGDVEGLLPHWRASGRVE